MLLFNRGAVGEDVIVLPESVQDVEQLKKVAQMEFLKYVVSFIL